MNSPLANAIMAIQGTNTFVDYEQRLIEAFLMAEEKFKTDDDSAEDKGTPSSSEERLELLSGSDEDAQGSIGEESELEAAEADAVPSSFVEPVEFKDAHTSRASWVAEKIGTLPSRFNAVVELRQPPFNIQSPSCGHPEHNAPAPLIIVMSTGTYRKRKSQVPEVIEPAKRMRADEPPIPITSSATASVVGGGFKPIYTMNTFASRQLKEQDRIYQRFRTVASLDPTISTIGEAAIDH